MCVKSIDERNESTRSSDLRRVGSGSITAIIAVAAAVLWAAPQAQSHTVIHVDKNSTGPVHDGSSWCSAYRELHEALAVAAAGMTIRVADGTYRPDATALADPREATFQLINGVALEGGYAGCGGGRPGRTGRDRARDDPTRRRQRRR